MKKILVATDYSAEAANAMKYAAQVAAERGYTIILFTLQNASIHSLNARMPIDTITEYLTMQEKKLKNLASRLTDAHGIEVIPYFASGDFYEEIRRCIEIVTPDFLIMGMPKKSFDQDILGNTTTTAIHRLQIPILAIPVTVTYNGIRKILFACDLAKGVYQKVLKEIRDFAKTFDAVVEVFHVGQQLEQISEQTNSIDQSMQGIEYFYKNVQSTNVIKAIEEELIQSEADLLIMVPNKYGFWNSLVHRSKTRVMASGNQVPLLSIPIGRSK